MNFDVTITSARGWRSLREAPPCPACADVRAQLIDAGVLRPFALSVLPADVDAASYLPLDSAGRTSAAASIAGLINDGHVIALSATDAPRRNRIEGAPHARRNGR